MNSRWARVVVILEGRDDKGEKADEETNLLHVLPAIHPIIDHQCRGIIAGQRHNDVDQVPVPGRKEGFRIVRDDADELT